MNLVAVLAHPDDEAYFCAGTLSKSAEQGHSVTLLCATKGERGEVLHPDLEPSQYPKGERLGQLRSTELEASCAALGINPPVFLGYTDSGYPLEVAQQNSDAFLHLDPWDVAHNLCIHFQRLQPDVVIGFDPYGMYGHIDHVRLHVAVTAAFWQADRFMDNPPKRLWFPVRSTIHQDQYLHVSAASLGAIVDVQPQATRIRASLEAHRSQLGTATDVKKRLHKIPNILVAEHYILAGLRGGIAELPVSDLFSGL
jgi:N-acetyl-1-D-myo-inositol-2-amino-2-deoxy-alpha-D-glucopyranoside deacetylase